ncbi:hypothetical protein V7127_04770 [Bacillus sp. JJ1773]|uniref:hypothetical protein n=1 Tax=Bacillus sp. JJ1773 TaxID=3122965 RepID=UPI002FFF23D7
MNISERIVNELIEKMNQMNQNHSESEIFVPGKGKFKIILQTENEISINEEVIADPTLAEKFEKSRDAYLHQRFMTSKELINRIKETDFNDEK